ncbi:hypothetical protein PaG_04508 [Moesziomyces aphidis]|uniref:Glycosyl transferase CAP10 domain-containing protein n=1 Tax=Moesziomyces aphidis TaxID=84754 RepID=W3VL36_MOEAP|nr:hypothetical protein PaG_04508 [Moesziomyces aphidis]
MVSSSSLSGSRAKADVQVGKSSPRLRANVFPSNTGHQALKDDAHPRGPSSIKHRGCIDDTAVFWDHYRSHKLGWSVAGGLAFFAFVLLFAKASSTYDDVQPIGYLPTTSSIFETTIVSMEDVNAACAQAGIHPIACKVDHAAKLASDLRARQSKTPEQAVQAYRRRYLRSPPRGYEKWVEFALKHNATVVDDYDQIEVDLSPFRQAGLRGDKLKRRILDAKAPLPGYEFGQVGVVNGKAVSFGPDFGPLSAQTLMEILAPVQHLIPDVTIPFNWYAEPRVPHPSQSPSSGALRSINTSHRDPTAILRQACPSNHISPGRPWNDLEPPIDYCGEDINELSELHGFLQAPDNFHPFTKLVPMLSRSKLSNFADILVPNPCYGSEVYRGLPDNIPWEKKRDSVYWRGSTTGVAQTPTTWARGHRHRMMRYVKQLREAANRLNNGAEVDPMDAIYASNRTIASSRKSVNVAGNTLPLFDYTDRPVVEAVKRLGSEAFNVTWSRFVLADEPTLASLMANQVTTGLEERNDVYLHKYLLDVDGQSMSCRFYQLLSSNSLVFKQTIWSEYHDDRLVPWIHYVPIDLRVENNELPMLLDFFIHHEQGPKTAAKIAAASKEWSDATLRQIDVSLYYARVLIEFAELYHQDS